MSKPCLPPRYHHAVHPSKLFPRAFAPSLPQFPSAIGEYPATVGEHNVANPSAEPRQLEAFMHLRILWNQDREA